MYVAPFSKVFPNRNLLPLPKGYISSCFFQFLPEFVSKEEYKRSQ